MTPRDTLSVLGVVALVVALAGAGVAVADLGPGSTVPQGQSTAPAQPAGTTTIEVSTAGEAQAPPDKAVIRLEVSATAADPTAARSQVAENVSDLRSALREVGIEESQVRTVDFNLWKDEPRRPGEEERGTVYRVRHRLVVDVEAIDRTGEVIDTAIESGATNIHDIRFTLSEETRSSLRTKALEDAMGDARSQADVIASSADLEITGVHAASTSDVRYPGRPVAYETAAAGGAGTDIQSGPVSVVATVSVTYNATG